MVFSEITFFLLQIKINARIKDKKEGEEPMHGEAPYEVERYVWVMFTNNTEQPIFNTSMSVWNFSFLEKTKTEKKQLTTKAFYEHPDKDDEYGIYYFIDTNDTRISDIFFINETTGDVSLKEELDYETDEEIEFNIVASNAENNRNFDCKATPRSCLPVRVMVNINFSPFR